MGVVGKPPGRDAGEGVGGWPESLGKVRSCVMVIHCVFSTGEGVG